MVIPGFPGYFVTENGEVSHSATDKWHKARSVKQKTDTRGYKTVSLRRNGKSYTRLVHRLILEAFIGEPMPGEIGRHLDGHKDHNYLTNLKWGTHQDNMNDVRVSGMMKGENNPSHKLTRKKVDQILKARRDGLSQRKTAKKFGVSRTLVVLIERGKVWVNE